MNRAHHADHCWPSRIPSRLGRVTKAFFSAILLIMDEKEKREKRIKEIEATMGAPDFWADKTKSQTLIKELQELKAETVGGGKYDSGGAVVTIFSGAGGDDSEDFSAMLFSMYRKFIERRGWQLSVIHQNQNAHGGFRNLTFEIQGRDVYGILKNESGVHRLVRISPFNAQKKRHTSFSMVEVIPKLEKTSEMEIPEQELKVEFARSSGPGGQNVNKRETAVRLVHLPTGIAVHAETERSQSTNREKALIILKGKLYKVREDERQAKEKGLYISKTTSIEWGNQIRSYVLHPYKMVKDHRTGVETAQVDKVLAGELDEFIEGEQNL
ncbi:MAG: Peptide chain release factor 2 [Parcubacteria group bacterium Gr01-1014_73]|nr:MAG: Peptide chain release factor 2 [Parcubacteria group bacterium Gr01-1014_73]